MKKIEFTEEQKKALKAEGTVLVAAAAGSGKTAVLVERVIRKLSKENGLAADRVLIVTFTNAAAAELRAKISTALKKKTLENPHSLHLKRQSILIEDASICTIDSFCINLVRENISSLGISADFKIADENSFKQEKEDILNELIFEKLNSADEIYLKTVSDLRNGYDDSYIKDVISSLYEKSCSMPYPEKWLNKMAEFNQSIACDFENSMLKSNFFEELRKDVKQALSSAIELKASKSLDEKFASKYETAVEARYKYVKTLSELIDAEDWDGAREHRITYQNKSLKANSSKELTISRNIIKSAERIGVVNSKIDKLFVDDLKTTIKILEKYSPIFRNVVSLVVDYKNKIDERFRSKNTFSFDMLEHMALDLLNNNESVRKAVNNRFDEILVDEYQDTNNLQDELFFQLSKTKRNLFMVGDVKQSIYGFRNANPDNFLCKKDEYPLFSNDEDPSKVILTGNFRSRKRICDFINFLFRAFMTKHDADMDYNDEEKLIPLGHFVDNNDESDVSINVVEAKDGITREEAEAEKVADYIIETMNREPFLDDGENGLRKAKFSDFVLLMRSPKKIIGRYVKVFEKRGVPINCPSERFSDATEIKISLSLLKTIDNPNNDISLFAVLTSPLFGFSEDELCEIVGPHRKLSLYSILNRTKDNSKVAQFLEFLSDARKLAITLSVDKLLLNVFAKTNFFDICGTMENSDLKKANLYLLIENAASYCANKEKGISDFVRYIESENNGDHSASVTTDSNAVRVMSFHSSKGLQFPICIVCTLSKDFNLRDTYDRCVCDAKQGAAFKFYDEEYGSVLTPCTYKGISESVKEKLYKEELRLLYVALTRAIEKLQLFITVKDREKYLEEATEKAIAASTDGIPFANGSLFQSKSFGQWILTAALCHNNGVALRRSEVDFPAIDYDCSFSIVFPGPDESKEITFNNDNNDIKTEIPDFSHIFDGEYPYLALNKVPAKTSVSDILKKNKNSKYRFSSRPSFLSDNGLTSSEKGTANHKFMECCDFEKASRNIDEEIERLIEWQYLTEAQAEVIDKTAISEFFKSDIYSLMKNSEKLLKEYRFITKVNCAMLDSEIPESLNEYTLVQGVADCIAILKDGIILVDFKTDKSSDEAYYKAEYSEQLDLYSNALAKKFALPVKKKIIYSFKLRKCIEL